MLGPRGHPLDPLVGRSGAEAGKRIFDPRGVGTPRSGVPTLFIWIGANVANADSTVSLTPLFNIARC